MDRVPLSCPCGWTFFVSDSARGTRVECPSCGQSVPVPGGRPAPVRDPARRDRIRRFLLFGLEALGVTALLVAIGLVVLRRDGETGSRKPPPGGAGIAADAGTPPVPPPAAPGPEAPAPAIPAPPPPPEVPTPARSDPPPAAPAKPTAPAEAWKKQVDQNVLLLNMAGIVAEVLRHRNDKAGYDRMVSTMGIYEQRVREGLAKLVEAGVPCSVPMRLAPQDKIVSFAGKDLGGMTSREAAAFLQSWTQRWQPGAVERCTVLRGPSALDLILHFPERNRSLLVIVEAAGAKVEDAGSWSTAVAPVPEPLIAEVRERFGALNPGYRKLVPREELEVMDRLLRNGRGLSEEIELLTTRIVGDLLPRFEQEAARCREKAKELEGDPGDTSSDVLVMKDGRTIEGKVLREEENGLVVSVGVGTARFNLADVSEVRRGRGSSGEFPARFKAAQGRVDDLSALLSWCRNNRLLARQRDALAGLILTKDPLNETARSALGLPRSFAVDKTPKPLPEPEPPPPAVRRPAGGPTDEEVFKMVSATAEEVARKYRAFSDVIYQMRDRTSGLAYSKGVPVPERFQHIAQIIVEPLAFRAINLSREQANTVQFWWLDLDPGNREDFARFFGLWCIKCRTLR